MTQPSDSRVAPLLEPADAVSGYIDELLTDHCPGRSGNGHAAAATPVVPSWAQPYFQALLFEVGNLKLAVPLVKLQSVVPNNSHIADVPGRPDWVHGMMRYRGCNVVIIDTARLVLPPRHIDADQSPPAHMLIVNDGRWGLACRRIGDVVRLTPAEISWRSREGRRPWLAGTVLGRMCALMDTEAFADMLNHETEATALRSRITENQ